MIITIFEVVYVSNIDGIYKLETWLFPTWEEAKNKYDNEVQGDKDGITLNGDKLYDYDEYIHNKEDDDEDVYVKEEFETSYTSYKYGRFADTFVDISLKEHGLEVK